ncbi:uncharacterized protein LOC141605744 [Silene latifolia]|uniref:uncharacterized protein LOC141605744 n=1 Tax=Silene latifolia TaxID=37657 RepID=UPI003D7744FB
MVDNKPDEESRKSVREFFGLNSLERDPIPCNTFNTLVKIYSLLPDQTNNPFAKYANSPQYTTLFTDGVPDNPETRRKKAVPYDSDYLSGVEVGNSSSHNETKSDTTAAAFYDDAVLRRPEMITNELGMSKNSEMTDNTTHDEEGTTVGTIGLCNVHEDLSSINRILMDESDDPDMLQLLDKDVNMDLACDFGSILDIDRPCDKSLTMESFESKKCIAGDITKKDAVHRKKRKGVEVDRSILEGEGISQAPKSADTVLSSCPEFVNQNVKCIKDAPSKDKKLSKQIAPRELPKTGDLASTEWERENVGQVSSGQLLDNVGRRNQLIVSAKAKKTKTKNTKKKSDKDIESGVGKLVRLEGEAYNNMKSGAGDPIVHGKIRKQVVLGILMSPSTKEDNERRPKACERLRYTREELLHLGKTAFVPEYIQKAAREIGAEIHEKHQISAAFAIADSSILKNKRGGSASEARKEKKKLKRRKQRAELNRKLGVKRLKLKPIVKPKVVQHCRHYLNGRCLEGEKCKFSHDVVPLTKSKPCCHFARQACMKGDDCPFDHQLSKYPCNNYSDTGFCNRGESCSFSHKIAVKDSSEPSTVPLKSGTSSVYQHDISKSKGQINASVPFTPGKTVLNNLKEVSTTKAIQPAKKPKGLTFFSFGNSQLDNSVLPKDSEFTQQSSYTVGASVQPVMVEGATSELKSLDRTSVDRLRDNKLPLPPPHGDNSSGNISFGMKLPNDSAKENLEDASGSSDYAAGTSTQDMALDFSKVFKGTSTPKRGLNLSEMFKDGPTQAKAKGIGVSSSGGPSYDITDRKSICYKEKGNTNLSHKSKDVQPERPILSSQTSLSQCPTEIDLPVKNPPSNSDRALQSALAFAAKYSSGFKTGSMAATKENALNEDTSCSGSKKSEPLQASKILQFLNGQGK